MASPKSNKCLLLGPPTALAKWTSHPELQVNVVYIVYVSELEFSQCLSLRRRDSIASKDIQNYAKDFRDDRHIQNKCVVSMGPPPLCTRICLSIGGHSCDIPYQSTSMCEFNSFVNIPSFNQPMQSATNMSVRRRNETQVYKQ